MKTGTPTRRMAEKHVMTISEVPHGALNLVFPIIIYSVEVQMILTTAQVKSSLCGASPTAVGLLFDFVHYPLRRQPQICVHFDKDQRCLRVRGPEIMESPVFTLESSSPDR